MTSLTMSHANTQNRDAAHLFWAATATNIAMLIVFALAEVFDTRTIEGVGNWIKPMKFALSLAVMFATMALVATRLSPAARTGRALHITGIAMIAAFWYENGYMAFQAAHGATSHFNRSTIAHEIAYGIMGLGAVTLVVGIAVQGYVLHRDKAANLTPCLRQGIIWGFILSGILTLIVASYMSAGTSHFNGIPAEGAKTIPLMGWSLNVGDYRPAHFLSLHAMQVLPLSGLALDRRGSPSTTIIPTLGIGYTILTLAVFAQAVMGLPLISL